MATIRTGAAKKKPAAKKTVAKKPTRGKTRAKPRFDAEEATKKRSAVTKSAEHKNNNSVTRVAMYNLGDGEVMFVGQGSELVPVADYASVTLGPNMIGFKMTGLDLSVLAEVDWDSDDPFTPEQQAVWDRARGMQKGLSALVEAGLSEDRESVDRSIRQHNEREKSEKGKK